MLSVLLLEGMCGATLYPTAQLQVVVALLVRGSC